MKYKTILTVSLAVALGIVATTRAQDSTAPAVAQPVPGPVLETTAPQFTEAQILEALGWFIGKEGNFSELGFSNEQIEHVMTGFQAAAAGKDAPCDSAMIGPEVAKFMQARWEACLRKLCEKNKAESEKFFAELKTRKGVIFTPSGLAYEILKPGTGEFPKPADTVKVLYAGTLPDGTPVDSTEGREPVSFELNGMIQTPRIEINGLSSAWTEGIQKVNKGGTIKLYIPASLGYGETGAPNVPPGSAVIFEIELVDIMAPAAKQ